MGARVTVEGVCVCEETLEFLPLCYEPTVSEQQCMIHERYYKQSSGVATMTQKRMCVHSIL